MEGFWRAYPSRVCGGDGEDVEEWVWDRTKGIASVATRGGEAEEKEKGEDGRGKMSNGEEKEKKEEKGDRSSGATSGNKEASALPTVVVDGEEDFLFSRSEKGRWWSPSDVISRIPQNTEG